MDAFNPSEAEFDAVMTEIDREMRADRSITATYVVLALFLWTPFVIAQRAIPDETLAYPVLLTLRNGDTGSGFYVSDAGAVYLVTARHVLFDGERIRDTQLEALYYSKDPLDITAHSLNVNLSLLGAANVKAHPTEDVAVIRILTLRSDTNGKVTAFAREGVTFGDISHAGMVGVDIARLIKLDHVLIGNDVVLLGYPTSLGLQMMPKIDSRRPLLRRGMVAGINPSKHAIILDCPVYFGNSGGPVLQVEIKSAFEKEFKIIGVVSEYVPFADRGRTFGIVTNSGYSIATPMDFVLELISK